MKIAVTYDKSSDLIHNQFETVRYFKIYEIENGCISHSEILATMSGDCESVIGMLSMFEVDAVICGNIEDSSESILDDEGIPCYTGRAGSPDCAIDIFLSGKI